MKKYIFAIALAVAGVGCKKSDLQLNNPNSPTTKSLETKTGIEYYSLGIFQQSGSIFDLPLFFSFAMGDEEISSVGNFGMRYTQQVNGITLPAPYNKTVPNIFGVTQADKLRSLNNFAADASQSNAFQFLWQDAYLVNGQANILLKSLDNTALTLPANEKVTLQAWAYWWKGIAYSQVGSMYSRGIINDNADGTTNNNYLDHSAIITEANANFDKAAALLAKIPAGDADYTTALTAITPSFNAPDLAITPAMWIRNIYTMEARNILVNTKVAAMTATQWAQVTALASKGLIEGDQAFSRGLDPNGVNDLTAVTQGHPFLWNNYTNNPGWCYASERVIQDFKEGDARLTKGITALPNPVVNIRSRGIQFGSRYTFTAIEDGGYWTTGSAHQGQYLYAGSWEETALMLGEAQIRTGNIAAGLPYIDHVRTSQGSGLAALAGTTLTSDQAVEELRRERRIGLLLRGVAFYDARRWGITAPKSAGGGRANANVLVPGTVSGSSNAFDVLPCFIDYDYLDYWDPPIDETTYNISTTPVTAQ